MSGRRFEYDVDADIDRRKMWRAERQGERELTPDEFRKMRYGVDGTKIFVCQVAPGVFTIKMLGQSQTATDINKIMSIISDGVKERFGL